MAEPNELHHGGWWTELRQAVDYALYRGNGRVCAVEIWSPRIHANERELELARVVLCDRTANDACPTQGRGARSAG